MPTQNQLKVSSTIGKNIGNQLRDIGLVTGEAGNHAQTEIFD